MCSLQSRHRRIVRQGAQGDEPQQLGKLKQEQKADEQRGAKVESQGRNTRGDGLGLQGQLQAQYFLLLAEAARPVCIQRLFNAERSIGHMPGRGDGRAFGGEQPCSGQFAIGCQQLFQRLILAAQAGNIHALVDEVLKIAPGGFGQDIGLGVHRLFDIGVKERQRAAGVKHLSSANDDQQHSGHARKAHAHSSLTGKQAKTARQNQPRHKAGRTQQHGRQAQKVVCGRIYAFAVNIYHQPAHGGFVA